MLLDELQEKLKATEPDLDTIKAYWQNSGGEQEFQRLSAITNQEDFWQNPKQAELLKELQKFKNQRDHYHTIVKTHDELAEFITLFASDEAELKHIKHELFALCKDITFFKINLLLSDPQDSSHCFFSINSGAGGTESQDWADILVFASEKSSVLMYLITK